MVSCGLVCQALFRGINLLVFLKISFHLKLIIKWKITFFKHSLKVLYLFNLFRNIYLNLNEFG